MNILSALLIILSIPVGFLIAWLARDELIQGRKWFIRIISAALILTIAFVFLKRTEIFLSCIFILIASIISYYKSFDKSWTKIK